jgi:hypothetical protein
VREGVVVMDERGARDGAAGKGNEKRNGSKKLRKEWLKG